MSRTTAVYCVSAGLAICSLTSNYAPRTACRRRSAPHPSGRFSVRRVYKSVYSGRAGARGLEVREMPCELTSAGVAAGVRQRLTASSRG